MCIFTLFGLTLNITDYKHYLYYCKSTTCYEKRQTGRDGMKAGVLYNNDSGVITVGSLSHSFEWIKELTKCTEEDTRTADLTALDLLIRENTHADLCRSIIGSFLNRLADNNQQMDLFIVYEIMLIIKSCVWSVCFHKQTASGFDLVSVGLFSLFCSFVFCASERVWIKKPLKSF